MNQTSVSGGFPSRGRKSLVTAVSLCLLMLIATLPAAAEYDPSRPSSNTGKGGGEMGSGDPGDGGGGDPGDGGGGGGTTRKVALGLASPGASLTDLDALTASIGKKPAIWAVWSQWGASDSRAFPTATAKALRDRNIQPMVWWEPVDPGDLTDPTYSRHRNISAGNHDAYIRQWARDARDFGGSMLLRFAHEANNNYFPWSINAFDNSPATFKDAWRHVVDIFREEDATNVRFVWSIVKKVCSGCNPYTEVYPGDAYVDVMGFTGYNWGTASGKTWTEMDDSFRRVTNKLRQVSDKPIMVAETGSSSVGGDKPAWIREGYRNVYAELTDIEAIVYLHADLRSQGHPDWRLTSPTAALAAYAEIAALSRFDTRSPFRGRVTAAAQASKKTSNKHQARKTPRRASRQQAATEVPEKRPRVWNDDAASVDRAEPRGKTARTPRNKATRKPKDVQEPHAALDPFNR